MTDEPEDGLEPISASALGALFGDARAAEWTLDLRGLDAAHAVASVDQMLERARFRAARRSVALFLAPPVEGGGETTFQPVGRRLLEARRKGILARLEALPPQAGLGFYLETTGRDDADSEEGGP